MHFKSLHFHFQKSDLLFFKKQQVDDRARVVTDEERNQVLVCRKIFFNLLLQLQSPIEFKSIYNICDYCRKFRLPVKVL